MTPSRSPRHAPEERLTPLVYELLDAHRDTIELAAREPDVGWRGCLDVLRWHAHLDYLRALQRTARELLAEVWAVNPAHAGDRQEGPS